MKYLHIMLANGASTYCFIRELFNHLSRDEFFRHEFIIAETLNYVIKNAPNLLVYNYDNVNYLPINGKKTAKLRLELMEEKMEAAEHIIWHSLIPMNTFKKAKLANKYCYKSAWVTMFGDRTKPNINSKDREARKLAREKLKFMQNVRHVNCTVPWFVTSFRKDYGDHKLISEIPYPTDSRHFDAMSRCEPNCSDRFKIILGFDGGTANKHEMLFTNLQLTADDNFSIIMPMNYAMFGEWGKTERWQYRERVLQSGINRFGAGNIVKLRRQDVPPEDYYKMYASCDIGVFNENRGAGLPLLFYMLYLGKKVFIKGSSVLVARLRSLYLPVYSLVELKMMDAQQLKAPVCDEDFLDMYRIEQMSGRPLTELVEDSSFGRIYKWNVPKIFRQKAEEPDSVEADNDAVPVMEADEEPSGEAFAGDAQAEMLESERSAAEEALVQSDDELIYSEKNIADDEHIELTEEQYYIYGTPMTEQELEAIRRRRNIGRKWLEDYLSAGCVMKRWLRWLESLGDDSGCEDRFDMNAMEGMEYDEQAT